MLRRNIEFAVELSEIGRFGWRDDFSIHSGNNAFRGQNRLSTWVQFLIVQFEKLCLFDPVAAQAEFSKWPHDDVEVFAKLRMWAIGKTGLIPNKQFTYVFESIPEEALWNPRHSSDLLPALKARWDDLNIENQLMVERKFIEGPPRWEDESDEAYQNRRTRRVLNRLIWLQQQGCTLQTDTSELEQLRSHIPEWQPEHAQDEMKANSSGVYRVRTKDDYSVLNGVPLNQILIRANEESGRSEDRRTQFDPFLGLSKERPVRAFSALRCAVKQGEIPEWAWRTFLQPHIRKEDKPRLTVLIAAQILRLPCEQAAKIIVPICYWINETCSVIAEHDQALFYQLISKSIKTLSHPVIQVHFSIVRGDREPDWLFESINSSVGQLTLSFFEEPQINWIKSDNESSSWLVLLENLLILPGESHRYVIAVMTRNLSWFYGINAHWTQKYLLSILDGSDLADKEAFWSGVLSGETILGEDIFFILKPYLIEMAHSDNAEKRRFLNSIVSLLSSAWSIIDEETSEKWVSDQELRDLLISADDKFRCQVLWNIRNFDEQIWFLHFKELISSVWPRQLVAKTPAVSHTFVEIALDAESHFVDVVVSILPFLTRLERAGDLYIHHDDFLKRHPKEAVLLFHTVLPDDAYLWPYAFGEWLETIKASYAEADDEQLIELSRKWDAR
ncbi:hypothetical protein [Vibrio spartinae]|uniref:hypothetical protein n=1 Tax=Vibrio spartinae TaxID=1918945 RepID=UPI0015F7C534|nr:hypothetical protein [Vibrio spartinae]